MYLNPHTKTVRWQLAPAKLVQTHSLSDVTLLLKNNVGCTQANWDVALLPLQLALPITMATQSRLQSKLVVGGKCESFCICFPPLFHLYHSLYFHLPIWSSPQPSVPLSAGNRFPASPYKYLLITISDDSWGTLVDNLQVHIHSSHIHPCRGQMGLLRQRVTDYSEVPMGCLVKAPGLQSEGLQEKQEWEKVRKRIRIKVEKKGQEKPEVSRERLGGSSKSFAQKLRILCRVLNTHSYQFLTIHTKTTILVID